MKSTRDAPWRLDVEVSGILRCFALRLASPGFEKELHILSAMEAVPLPTPRVYGWDPDGDAFGIACFFMDYVDGASLKEPTLAGEEWAEALFIDSVCDLQMVTRGQLTAVTQWLGKDETACNVLENAYAFLGSLPPDALVDEAYAHGFLLSPFLNPVLRERGLEERYCHRMGFDAGVLRWYHGLEYFDSWHWVLKTWSAV